MTAPPKYARTKTQLAEALGITPQALYKNWIDREDFPEPTSKGWNVAKCLEYKLGHDRRSEPRAGANTDLARRKLDLECEKLEEQLRAMRRQTIPVDEHADEIRATANIVLDAWKFLRQEFAASLKDPEVLKLFDAAEDRARARVVELVGEDGSEK